MISFAAAFIVALGIAAVLTPAVRRLSYRLKLYDTPDERKLHHRVVPRTGGVAIVIAFLVPILGIALTEASVGQTVYKQLHYVTGIIVGSMLIMGVGLLDDLRGLGAKKKFLLQLLIATFAFAVGFRIENVSLPFLGSLEMGMFSYLVTVVWIVGIINAINLIDGLDGLAGGIAFFVLIFNFVIGYMNHSVLVCLIAAALAGAILGFLFYNFNPASIFMGDAGSMFIGYVLALGAINSGQKYSTTVALLTPIIAMGIPIMDTLFSIARRFLERRSMFSADRGHIHHRLLEMGITQRRTVMILYAFTILLVVVALVVHVSNDVQLGMGLVLMVLVFVVFARIVGVADYFTRRRLRRMGVRTPRAERLRTLLFDALVKADALSGENDMPGFLEWLGKGVQFTFVVFCYADSEEPVAGWENDHSDKDRRKRTLVAAIPLFDAERNEFAMLKFGWLSERGRVTSETEILLQVIADRLGMRLLEAGGGTRRRPEPR